MSPVTDAKLKKCDVRIESGSVVVKWKSQYRPEARAGAPSTRAHASSHVQVTTAFLLEESLIKYNSSTQCIVVLLTEIVKEIV
jgi:hypothetical protein